MGDLARTSSAAGRRAGDHADDLPLSETKCSSMGLRINLAARASAYTTVQ